MRLLARFYAALAVILLIYIVASLSTYIVGMVNPPSWLLPYINMMFFSVFVFALAVIVAIFVHVRHR